MRRFGCHSLVFICVLYGSAAGSDNSEDAPLHAVHFVDRNEGWTAGADGVLLHTIDGGAHWERQSAPTKGRLNHLQFLTPYTGYAVGREEVQVGGGSFGVLLNTTDGGLTWTRLSQGILPGIQAATFFDELNGIAAGDATERAPGGLFRTHDGGQTWQTMLAPRGGTWLALAARDQKSIALTGASGRLGAIFDNEFTPADIDPLGGKNVLSVALDGNRAIAVGQGGLVLLSPDSAARRYGFVDLGIPAAQHCDFHGLATFGSHIWIVGSPGTVVFHSADAGKTWQTLPTGQNLTLHGVHFLDENHGWAVGELGLVLATTNGGKTWQVQRRGGQRAAVLCMHTDSSTTPLDLVAALGGDEGYLVAATTVADAEVPFRLQTAMRKTGGAAGDSISGFSLPSHARAADRATVLAHWDRPHAGKATDTLLARLVLAIRIWQPDVIVTGFAASQADSLIVEMLQQAFQRAADPAAFPEQLDTLKLTPWQPKKLYTLWDGPGQPHVVLPTTDSGRILPESPREYANKAIGLITEQPLPKLRGLRLLASSLPDEVGRRGIMDGILLAPGGTARRALPANTAKDQSIEQPLRELRTIINLSQSGLPQVGDPGAVLAGVGRVLDKLPADRGAAAVFGLAEQYAKSGQWMLASETMAIVLERYPKQAHAIDACRWLIRYYSSSEARRRLELGQQLSVAQTDFRQADHVPTKDKPFRPGTGIHPLASSSTARNTTQIHDPAMARRQLQSALDLESRLVAFGPLIASEPSTRLCLNSAKRQLGDADPAKVWLRSYLAEQAGATGTDAWRDVARMELWHMERSGLPPRPVVQCRRTNQRPHLDARLDEAMWTDAVPAQLKHNAGTFDPAYTAEARFAFDDDWLYVAIDCKYPAGQAKPAAEKRHHDMDLSAFDRVELLLDLDRDYQTYYRFRIDQRGALAEDCWGDTTWNPKWYVACNCNDEGYTAEVAISLADLTGTVPTPGQAWAVNIVRVLPGRGIASWSSPADASPHPEGCGAIIFTGTK